MDRQLIADIIERTMRRDPRFGTWTRLERAVGISHTQMYRVKSAGTNVSVAMFERIEGALDLPADTLVTAGAHDVEGLRELGVPDEIVRFVVARLGEDDGFRSKVAEAR